MKTSRMKAWLLLPILAVILAVGYIAAGPFVAIHGIREAIREQDASELSRHIDYVALRSSFKQQLDDYLVRRAGPEAQSSLTGAVTLRMASGATGLLVDVLATPAGLAAILEGRNVWHRASSLRDSDAGVPQLPPDPLEGAKYAFESSSRFTATVINGDGQPVVFVLTRTGLRWKITDVSLPL